MNHLAAIIVVGLLGLSVGSFLNVVVYRLSAGLSIASPRWSFCPGCRSTIRWWDNIPVLSWFALAGRCRQCRMTISVQYPLLEAATGLAFVLVYVLLFVSPSHAVLRPALPGDTPLLLMWLALVAALVACTAMDFVSYSIDIRVTWTATIAGILLHAAWPRSEHLASTAAAPSSAAALAALLFALVVSWLWERRPPTENSAAHPEPEPAMGHSAPERRTTRVLGGVGTLLLVGLAIWISLDAGGVTRPAGDVWLVGGALGALFLTLVLAGGAPREADAEIAAAIEDERPAARGVAGGELLMLAPALAAGVLAFFLAQRFATQWQSAVGFNWAGFTPIAGALVAVKGLVIAATAGWVLRIVFTLIYGREALGVGDIHILAAAGACAGWQIALLGLILSVGFALAGWAIGLLLKRTTMIPLGPWLAIGMVTALWLHSPVSREVGRQVRLASDMWRDRPEMIYVLAGVMLVATTAAVVISRLLRRLIAPEAA